MCCDPMHDKKDHDADHKGQCPECGADVDADGNSVDLSDCGYSRKECKLCGWRPCDGSC
jgi:hypothetical protein